MDEQGPRSSDSSRTPSLASLALFFHQLHIDPHVTPGLPSDTLMGMVSLNSGACARRLAALAAASMLGAALLNAMPRGERHEVRHEIDHLEDHWRDAILNRNVAAMDTLLASDYMAITANGTLQSKEETLSSLRSGSLHIKTLELTDRKVRFYGATALVTSRAEVTGTTPEGELTGSYRYTRVYVRDTGGIWRIVSFEASRIREPAGHK
jgi:ketosteroid isomerase-like protein